ncbi:MAG: hypothetical protein CL477_01990 [Acidobacteria bacterium]|jgi:hypothetical protein|nr:hypothetical protein [Acidobacteriota bacterium]HJN42558.1 superinfection immunity protein [Vicinamibacterales bacterium]|tara:strand:- start:664 stop:855 length:192 start_codon:yes stop_codon:yes gene_type:complete
MEGFFVLIAAPFVYFAPYILARLREKRDAEKIGMLTLLLGWTVIGWVGLLVWASRNDPPPQRQ